MTTDTSSAAAKSPSATTFQLIQPWHVVLGDTHARADRTTTSTIILRNLKEEYKQRFYGQKRSLWIPTAIQDLRHRLRQEFSNIMANDVPEHEIVLLKCTGRVMEAKKTKRHVLVPNVFGYKGDPKPTYGTAKFEDSITFFLTSRDSETFEQVLVKFRHLFDNLRQSTTHPSRRLMDDFEETLVFFENKVARSQQKDPLSIGLLSSLKPLNTIKEQWKLLLDSIPASGDDTEESRECRKARTLTRDVSLPETTNDFHCTEQNNGAPSHDTPLTCLAITRRDSHGACTKPSALTPTKRKFVEVAESGTHLRPASAQERLFLGINRAVASPNIACFDHANKDFLKHTSDTDCTVRGRQQALIPHGERDCVRRKIADTKPSVYHKQRALVIDDSMVVRKTLARALEKLGFSVTQAPDGVEGLKHLKKGLFDLILCDFFMPIMDGVDCVMNYREWGKENRPWFSAWIVGISSLAEAKDGYQCVSVGGMNDFKTKPMSIQDLCAIQTNEQVLERSRKIDELEASMTKLSVSSDNPCDAMAQPYTLKEDSTSPPVMGGAFSPLPWAPSVDDTSAGDGSSPQKVQVAPSIAQDAPNDALNGKLDPWDMDPVDDEHTIPGEVLWRSLFDDDFQNDDPAMDTTSVDHKTSLHTTTGPFFAVAIQGKTPLCQLDAGATNSFHISRSQHQGSQNTAKDPPPSSPWLDTNLPMSPDRGSIQLAIDPLAAVGDLSGSCTGQPEEKGFSVDVEF